MSKQSKDKRPYLPPVKRIELSEENIRGRWILLILLVCIGIGGIGFGIHYALDVQPGWNEIQAACDEPNYSSEFFLMYDFSAAGGDAAAVNKGLSLLYSEAMENAYRIFSKDAQSEGLHNLYYLNTHVNEVVTVDADLYKAMELLMSHDNRCIYLAPVYVEYNRVFNSESDAEAMLYDPSLDPETADYIRQLMGFVADEKEINLELLGNDQVKLAVSDGYLAFAREYGIDEFLDFGWMRNAFVADYVAGKLIERGYTWGYLASFDGYTRSLANAGTLGFNIFDRQDMDIYGPAQMYYEAPMSIVFLRDYPLGDQDRWNYHVYQDGRITSVMINPENGISGTAIPNLVCYAEDVPCAKILMEMIPLMFGREFDEGAVMALSDKKICSIWCREGTLFYTQQDIVLELRENEQRVRYETAFYS